MQGVVAKAEGVADEVWKARRTSDDEADGAGGEGTAAAEDDVGGLGRADGDWVEGVCGGAGGVVE